MLLDGLTLISGSEIQNVHVESGTTFPVGPTQGRIFYLTAASGGNAVGLYVFDGLSWVTGDITGITTGTGLTGGGSGGAISLAVDTSTIATTSSVTTAVGTVAGDLSTHIADATKHLTSDQNIWIDAITASSAEVNYLVGVTSSVQTQLGTKALAADLSTHTGDASVHLTSGQNTLLDGLSGSLTSTELNYMVGVTSSVQTQLGNKLNLVGGTMTGNIVMSADQTVTVPTPTGGFTTTNAVNKAYVDSLVSGLTWLNPILDPDLMSDSLSAPPGSPVTNAAYLIGATPSGAWAGLAGHVVYWSGAAWVDILGRAVAIGDRFGITMEHGSGSEGGSFVGNHNKIAQITTATPGSYAYTFTAPLSGQATFVNNASSQHFGHSYTYDLASTTWVEFGGPNATPAGIGLGYTGNVLNVNLGAGISELPTDDVGIDLYSASGLFLTTDGTTSSTSTNAQLAVKLDGSTIARSANGVKVSAAGITATEIAAAALGADLTGGAGTAITLTTTGVSANTYKSVTVDTKGRVTAGTNPTTLSGFGITDAAPLAVGYNAFTATASQTVFMFSGFTNVIGSHRLMVFVGGIKQLESAYTETTTQITLSTGLTAGTSVEIYFR